MANEQQQYGPSNRPRLRKPGESVEQYRVAMGWDQPKHAVPSAGMHTPGPWGLYFDQPDEKCRASIGTIRAVSQESEQHKQEVTTVYGCAREDGEALANARLITAAPELLEVLQEIVRDGMHCDVVPHLHAKALAAIAKAQGRA